MTTLITGAGLVGTSYALCARARGEDVVFLDPLPRGDYLKTRLGEDGYSVVREDVRHLPGLIDAIRSHDVDVVLHTAGLIGRKVEEPLHNGMDLNVNGAIAVCEAVRLTGVRRLLSISTFGAYDWRRPAPGGVIREDFARGSGTPYSNTKAAQELILEAYQHRYGFEVAIVRPANVFGVGHFWGGSGGGEKCHALVESGLRGAPARIPEEQTMAFEYVYSRDVGRALDLCATRDLSAYSVFNVGIGAVTSFDELVAAVRASLPDLEVEVVPGRPPVSRGDHMDIGHARDVLGWRPEYTLEAGFAAYIDEMRPLVGADRPPSRAR